jgi:hypothetical protein
MSTLLHVTEIGDDVRSLAESAASDDIKTDAPECAGAVHDFENLGERVAAIVREKPIVIASSAQAAGALITALRGALAGNPTAEQRAILDAFAGLLDTGAAARRSA